MAAHAFLGALQGAGILGGDYGSHDHESVFPVTLGALTAAAVAFLGYTLHLAESERNTLPHLARALRARAGWRSALAIAALAIACLAVMESAEQFAAGHFDGIASAFGSSPAVGLALVAALAFVVNLVGGGVWGWLAHSHERIARALSYVLRASSASVFRPTSSLVRVPAAVTGGYALYRSRVHGRRAPPVSR